MEWKRCFALEYAKSLVILSDEQMEINACKATIDELKTLSDKWDGNLI